MENIKNIPNEFFFGKFIKNKRILSYTELQKERELKQLLCALDYAFNRKNKLKPIKI